MNTLTRILLIGVAAASLAACDFLEQEPETSLPLDQVFDNEDQANALLVGAYDQIQDFIDDATIFAELAAETATHTGSYPSWFEVDNHSLTANNAEASGQWTASYNLILIANLLIENTPDVADEAFTDAEKDNVVGQALVFRAYAYHNLVRWFGGVPLILEPTTGVEGGDQNPARASVDAVYDQIIADLEAASDVLPANNGQGFVDYYVARALLARVLLYDGQYERAASVADEVIQAFELVSLDQVYTNLNSEESIWELQYNVEDGNAMAFFAFLSSFGGRHEYGPSNAFVDEFIAEGGDRLGYNLVQQGNSVVVNKYYRVVNGEDHHFIIRLPELLLIRAEALAFSEGGSDYEEEVGLINEVRERAGLDPLDASTITTDEELLDAVLSERRYELAFEGHRWHDLVRTGRAVEVLDIEPTDTRWPIPQDEIDINSNLEQNPGY